MARKGNIWRPFRSILSTNQPGAEMQTEVFELTHCEIVSDLAVNDIHKQTGPMHNTCKRDRDRYTKLIPTTLHQLSDNVSSNPFNDWQ